MSYQLPQLELAMHRVGRLVNPGATTGTRKMETISAMVVLLWRLLPHLGLELTGMMKVTNLNSLEQNQNITLSGSSTELIFSVASSL